LCQKCQRFVLVFLSYFSADIALIGLAVMGQNLILNMNDHGWVVCAYNRTVDKVSTIALL
jgi:6-phosphogluconate dehydrogenase